MELLKTTWRKGDGMKLEDVIRSIENDSGHTFVQAIPIRYILIARFYEVVEVDIYYRVTIDPLTA